MSWEELNVLGKLGSLQQAQEQERRNQAFYALFSTPLGQEVLESIRLHTEAKTTLPGQAMDGQAMALLMACREGENNLYRWIKSIIEKGHPNAHS